MISRVHRAGIYAGAIAKATGLEESALHAARGSWTAALASARRTEDASLPVTFQMSSARIAALGAWLEALDAEALDRLVVARLLRKRGEASSVEHYRMWPDGGLNSPSAFSVQMALVATTTYERASAFEAVCDRASAIGRRRSSVGDQALHGVHRAL